MFEDKTVKLYAASPRTASDEDNCERSSGPTATDGWWLVLSAPDTYQLTTGLVAANSIAQCLDQAQKHFPHQLA